MGPAMLTISPQFAQVANLAVQSVSILLAAFAGGLFAYGGTVGIMRMYFSDARQGVLPYGIGLVVAVLVLKIVGVSPTSSVPAGSATPVEDTAASFSWTQPTSGPYTPVTVSDSMPLDSLAYAGLGDDALAEDTSENIAAVGVFTPGQMTLYRSDMKRSSGLFNRFISNWSGGVGSAISAPAIAIAQASTGFSVNAMSAAQSPEHASAIDAVFASSDTPLTTGENTLYAPNPQQKSIAAELSFLSARVMNPEIMSHAPVSNVAQIMENVDAQRAGREPRAIPSSESPYAKAAAGFGYDEVDNGIPASAYVQTHMPIYLSECVNHDVIGKPGFTTLPEILSPSALTADAATQFLTLKGSGSTSSGSLVNVLSSWLNGSASLKSLGGVSSFLSGAYSLPTAAAPPITSTPTFSALSTAQDQWASSDAPEALSNRACLDMGKRLAQASQAFPAGAQQNADAVQSWLDRSDSYALESDGVLAANIGDSALAESLTTSNDASLASVLAAAASVWTADAAATRFRDNSILLSPKKEPAPHVEPYPYHWWTRMVNAVSNAIDRVVNVLKNILRNILTLLALLPGAGLLLAYLAAFWYLVVKFAVLTSTVIARIGLRVGESLAGEHGGIHRLASFIAIPNFLDIAKDFMVLAIELCGLAATRPLIELFMTNVLVEFAGSIVAALWLTTETPSMYAKYLFEIFMVLGGSYGIIMALFRLASSVQPILFATASGSDLPHQQVAAAAGSAVAAGTAAAGMAVGGLGGGVSGAATGKQLGEHLASKE